MGEVEFYESLGLENLDEVLEYLELDTDDFTIPVQGGIDENPKMNEGVTVDGLPRVPAEKVNSLREVLLKLFKKAHIDTEIDDILLSKLMQN